MGEGRGGSEAEQFVARGRYTVIPRTLIFLRHGDDVLLLKGAPTKRLWAGRYNGLGGHVEPGETIAAAALRECREEAGLAPEDIEGLTLRALINVEGDGARVGGPGVLLCVFVGVARTRAVAPSREGTPEWIPIADLGRVDLVDGDRLLPRLLTGEGLLFGHQRYDGAGQLGAFTLA
ncbi:MAG: NUDIX domain-containing protein [Chloroflexota bacterium]|nr:NUDIX domain-containing protein [Chloroflexota bacterium]